MCLEYAVAFVVPSPKQLIHHFNCFEKKNSDGKKLIDELHPKKNLVKIMDYRVVSEREKVAT